MALKHTVRPHGSGSRRTFTGEPDPAFFASRIQPKYAAAPPAQSLTRCTSRLIPQPCINDRQWITADHVNVGDSSEIASNRVLGSKLDNDKPTCFSVIFRELRFSGAIELAGVRIVHQLFNRFLGSPSSGASVPIPRCRRRQRGGFDRRIRALWLMISHISGRCHEPGELGLGLGTFLVDVTVLFAANLLTVVGVSMAFVFKCRSPGPAIMPTF